MDSRISRSITVPYTAEEMFDLVDGIERYRDFLPWCADSAAERNGESVKGTMEVSFGPFRKSFTTANRHVRPERIEVRLVQGPLDDLQGVWTFTENAGGGCSVGIDVTFRFSGSLHQRIANKVLVAIYGKMLEAFSRRARQVYGPRRLRSQGSVQA
jgi:ribosome-associated toxin RatA of RatAB toxin-antitoxin module